MSEQSQKRPINYRRSYNLLEKFADDYNKDKPLRDQIRQPQKVLMQQLIQLYASALCRQKIFSLDDYTKFESLYTNNVQLAKRCGVHKTSIINHLKRLQTAGLITDKTWHGSNASYEVWINPTILVEKVVDNDVKMINKSSTPQPEISPTKIETFNHTKTSSTKEEVKIIDNNTTVVNKGNRVAIDSLKDDRRCRNEGTKIEVQPSDVNTGSQPEKGYTRGGADPQDPPSVKMRKKRMVEMFWLSASTSIYNKTVLTDLQIQKGKELIYHNYYKHLPADRLEDAHQWLLGMIVYVHRWMVSTHWTPPVPTTYFAWNSKPGTFVYCRDKYVEHRKRRSTRKKATTEELILKKELQKFYRNQNCEEHRRIPQLEQYRRCTQRLGKLGDIEIINKFNMVIQNYPTLENFNQHTLSTLIKS